MEAQLKKFNPYYTGVDDALSRLGGRLHPWTMLSYDQSMPARMIEVMRMLETWEIRTLLRILRDERVRQIAIRDYGAAPLEKLIKVLEAKLTVDKDNQP